MPMISLQTMTLLRMIHWPAFSSVPSECRVMLWAITIPLRQVNCSVGSGPESERESRYYWTPSLRVNICRGSGRCQGRSSRRVARCSARWRAMRTG